LIGGGSIQQFVCPIHDESQVGAARRRTRHLSEAAALGEVRTERAAIVATELAGNMLRHAGGGELYIRAGADESFEGVELLAVDRGPGISDVRRSLEDGHSTGGTPGTGLGAARRLSTLFDLYSEVGRGTVVVSRIGKSDARRATGIAWGLVATNAPGEEVSGDQWAIVQRNGALSFMMVDGLGHGLKAHEAAMEAEHVFRDHVEEQPGVLLQRIHTALRSSRGAAVALGTVDLVSGTLTYAGVGNIAATLIRTDGQSQGLVSNNGTVGADTISVKEFQYQWEVGERLVMHTDGLRTRWSIKDRPGLGACHPAIVAAFLHRDFLRGRDDATVAVLSR
jgi:anti-sigma regulatory factor (Ser/Thr protein kinase)